VVEAGYAALVDATFLKQAQRQGFAALAASQCAFRVIRL
jgi:predicted kinase